MRKYARATVLSMMGLVLTSSVSALGFELTQIGRYETGIFEQSAQEISAYDPATKRLFVTNAANNTIEIISVANPANPVKVGEISTGLGGPNSVAVRNGVVAVAVEAAVSTDAGQVQFYSAVDSSFLGSTAVGALPDMLTFSPDGTRVLVANEAESSGTSGGPNPAGSVSVLTVDVSSGPAGFVAPASADTADFTAIAGTLSATSGDSTKTSARIHPNAPTIAQDIEPEYLTISGDSKTAYVSLQENNAIAVLDVQTNTITHILPLGVKDHSKVDSGFIGYTGLANSSNALDASDRDLDGSDGKINIENWNNIYGMYMPDAIAIYEVNGRTYVLTANEGDSRDPGDFPGYGDEGRLRSLTSDLSFDSNVRENINAGRLTVSSIDGDLGGDSNLEEAYAFGTRSFSIWDVTDPDSWGIDPVSGNMKGLVFDSGDDFERIIEDMLPDYFNVGHDNPGFDNRSDNKGPEPEGIIVGDFMGRSFAFIGLERIGGVMVYDVTDPLSPVYLQYLNTRDFTQTDYAFTGDLGPEGMLWIPASDSPNGNPLLVVTNEVTGSTAFFQFSVQTPAVPEPVTATLGLMGMGALMLATRRRK